MKIRTTRKPPKHSIVDLVRTGPTVTIGGFKIVNCSQDHALTRGKVWLENAIGEGMTYETARLENTLRRIFAREF